MRKREFPFKSRLDLHGMRVITAQSALISFMQQAYIQGICEVLLITGKGNNSPQGIAIIRESVTKWLTQYPLNLVVLGFTTPSRYLGGEGAVGVLLRPFEASLRIVWHQYMVERE
ncbi:MAG: Smr/MutS family protein [Desulfovibrionaceae bacterium]